GIGIQEAFAMQARPPPGQSRGSHPDWLSVATDLLCQLAPIPCERSPRIYHVHWKIIKCQNSNVSKKELSAITELTSFEIYELNYRCSYKVNVNTESKSTHPESELIIHVPGCEYFKKKLKSNALHCES
ncbi:hypothetical protein evm_015315, partial [Chilo suppressalis]